MPTYIYEIEETGERFEVRQSMGDKRFTTLGEVPEYKGDNPDGKIQRIITGGGGFKMDGKFNSMSGLSKRADLNDHLQEIKKKGKEDAQASRDMSMPSSKPPRERS